MNRHLLIVFATVTTAPALVFVLAYPAPAITHAAPLPQTNREYPILLIPLAGPVSSRDAEISGMAWSDDHLILLPQYPDRFQSSSPVPADGALFLVPKSELLAFIAGDLKDPLTPTAIPFFAPDLRQRVPGFEGFESVVTIGEKIFMTIEARQPNGMLGYLVSGTIAPDLSAVHLNTERLAPIDQPVALDNMADESLLSADENLISLFEANGFNVNHQPVAHVFNTALTSLGTLPFPNIEYRITDATSLDADKRFWAINYLYPGDIEKLDPARDGLAERFGDGPTHAQYQTVERLVEFQYGSTGIVLTDTPPIQLQLLDDQNSRNWEGIVRLDNRGFLLVTDKFPMTMLGFVAYPKRILG